MRSVAFCLFLLLFCGTALFPRDTEQPGVAGFPDGGFALYAAAQNAHAPGLNFDTPPLLAPHLAGAPDISATAAVLIDAATGTVLYARNPGLEIPPASLTKVVAMHLVQNAVAAGRASMDEIVPIGIESWAQNQPPFSSLMFLEPGQIVTLRELMLGLAVPSGNDASVAVALRFSPSVDEFTAEMTREMRRMGLVRTRFVEPSGISALNMTTAAEFTSFSREYLRRHPRSLAEFHSVREFAFPTAANVRPALRANPGTIVQEIRNTLLWTFPGVDGLKTGFIPASGFNVALTAARDDTRFIATILGSTSAADRNRDGDLLLSWAFDNFRTVRLATPRIDPARLWKGRERHVALLPTEPLVFTAPLDRVGDRAAPLWFAVELDGPLVAPLPAFHPAGWLVLADDAGEVHRVRLVTAREYGRGNIFRRAWGAIRLFFMGNNR